MDDAALQSLGQWIKRRRKALDLTQEALAALIGCSKDLIVRIEGDARRPSRQIAALLAQHLQLAEGERDAFVACARAELAVERLPSPTRSVPRAAFAPPGAPDAFATLGFPRGTLTFLFTDVEGSTRLWEQHGATAGLAIARQESLVRQAVESAGGVVFKTVGDAVCAAFADAAAALQAALAVQHTIQAAAWGAVGQLALRNALHTGAAESIGTDYAGLTLSRVTRLLATGHGGQVLLSRATYELVREQLPSDVALRDLGVHRLKDLSLPEQIFQLVAPGLRADFAPLRALDARVTNLPAQRTALIGREADIAAAATLLQADGVRLVTLTGPGGTGKTRLALQVAAELVDVYADGVWFVDLAAINDPKLVVTAIAQTLGVSTTSERPADQLKAALRSKHLLLLLDNFEQVLDAAPLIAEVLAGAARLTVLVTSRVKLHLSGEYEYTVSPLALPDTRQLPLVERLTQYAAVALFIERARAAKADFALTNANAPAVAEICVRLDGLPLALELAAARVKLFSPAALLAQLERDGGLSVLTGGARDLPQRQQTIRSTIVWSYHLLDEDEQGLFRRLGVFVGGFTLDAAAAVGVVGDDSARAAVDRLAALVDHSLVLPVETADGESRYHMLETLREYALERLRDAGEELDTRQQHAAYLAAWAEEVVASTDGGNRLSSEALARELENMRAALAWSLARADEDARYGLRLFACLWELWFLRYREEGGVIVERALAHTSAGPQDLVAAQIYNAAARMPKDLGDSAYGIALLERSLALARQHADRLLEAEVLRHLGEALVHHDLTAAERVLTESLQISRELDAAEEEGWTTYVLGLIAKYRDDRAAAERRFQQSLALFARLGDPLGQKDTLHELAYLAEERGDPVAADAYLARELAFVDQLGPLETVSPLVERGQIACRRGDYQRALELLRTGYEQAWQRGGDELAAEALLWLARCHQELGELDAAAECCRQAQVLVRASPLSPDTLSILAVLTAHTAVLGGQYKAGARVLGCIAAERATTNYSGDFWWAPEWNRVYDRTLAMCRAELDAATFEAGWVEGQALSLEQTVEQARAAIEPGKAREAPDRTV